MTLELRPITLALLALLGSLACAGPTDPPEVAPFIDCGRIASADCVAAIALVEAVDPSIAEAFAIVMDDTCPPNAVCDRPFAFEAAVVVVPFHDQGLVQTAYRVAGVNGPQFVAAWEGALPGHLLGRIPTT